MVYLWDVRFEEGYIQRELVLRGERNIDVSYLILSQNGGLYIVL